jgi:crotonobetainyl-CoA:carnitine CoA-transferase CaiB-like acyl-CoA transferase
VKVERPGGDPYRQDPARFAAWNRAKRSVVLDLATAADRQRALELTDAADVVFENLRPGALGRLGLAPGVLRCRNPRLVTCSISAYGAEGPARDEPGWEPLVHARAGAQQGLVTGDEPVWLPFPMGSIAAGLLAVLGVGAALVKRETTGYGQHVETSLLDGLLFLNAGAIFHRPRTRPAVIRLTRNPILNVYRTRDGGAVQVNLSGTERWRELCRVLGMNGDGGLDFANPASLVKLRDREWSDRLYQEVAARFAARTANEWEEILGETPAAASKCNTLEEWLAHEQVQAEGVLAPATSPTGSRLVAPPVRLRVGETPMTGRVRRAGGPGGALAGHRVVDMSNFWAGPLAARLLAELGADVIKVEPPGGEGAYQLVPVTPNIYMDGNRSKRGITLDLHAEEDRRRLLDMVRTADVVVENALGGTWERLGLDEAPLRRVNPSLVYARVKGFGLHGPLASRPAFDFVLQAATGMEMTQGHGDPQPVNFTANDYGTGLLLAAGVVLALVAQARGAAVTGVDASLMLTATLFQAEDVAQLTFGNGHPDAVGADLKGPMPSARIYQATDGWVVVCAVTTEQQGGLRCALGGIELSSEAIAEAIAQMTVEAVCQRLGAHGVPVARSVHPGAVPDDAHIRRGQRLATVRHAVAGQFVQVGVPLRLSVDRPAVKGPAPAPTRGRSGVQAPAHGRSGVQAAERPSRAPATVARP